MYESSGITSGQEVWDKFMKAVYPVLFIKDLIFDGTSYTIRGYDEGHENVKTYKYLMKYEGKAETPDATYTSYVRYVLTNNNTVTWEQIIHGIFSSSGDYIDHYVVYTELS